MAEGSAGDGPHDVDGSSRGADRDPYGAFKFKASITGLVVAGFSDVSGLGVETEVEAFRAGGVNGFEMQLAGFTKFSTRLVLKRGLARDSVIWNWYRQVLKGEIVRRNVMIQIRSIRGEDGPAWTYIDACPVKWSGPELHAGSSAIAFESIELVHRGLLLN